MRILIVDDHTVVRQGVKRVLADAFPKAQFGEAANAAEALALVRKQPWTLVVMDVGLPGRNGIDVLKELKSEYPALPVLIQSMYGEQQYAIRAIRAGAAGYITKEAASDVFVQALKKILDGGKYISPALAESLADDITHDSRKPLHDALSDREYQILRMLGSGKSVKEIGLQLSLSVKTISTYRTRVLEKMKLNTTAELIHYAISHSIAE